MKQLLVMLVKRLEHPWWELRSGSGEPPEERTGHYVMPGLLKVILSKLKHVEKEHEPKTPIDP